MPDTAQPETAAETEVVSTEDQLQAAAQAFRTFDPEAPAEDEQPERPRDDRGRFTSQGEPEEAEEAEPGEVNDQSSDEPEAAEEAQPDESSMPDTWPADKAELWEALEPDAQAFIRQRDADQKAAVNAKFMEAANLRKAHEAEIIEAQRNRQAYAQAAELALSLIQPPPPPPISMLDINSHDYDPDQYHYQKAIHEQTVATLQVHQAQLAQVQAQDELQRFHAINNTTRDGLIQEVPDIADQQKAPAIFNDLIGYAVGLGVPQELFDTPTTAVEWRVLWKAREYDRLQKATAKVRSEPKPQPKPQPAVRPGVTTPRSAIEKQKRGQAMDRLRREGSIDAGAAALKHLLKGNLS